MKKLLLLLVLLLGGTIHAQMGDRKFYLVDSIFPEQIDAAERKKLDSLLTVYHAAKHDSIRLKTLHRLCLLNDNTVWPRYNRKLIADSRHLTLKKDLSKREKYIYNQKLGSALYNMNYYFSMINQEDSSLKYIKLCIEPFRISGDQSGLADAYSSLGVYYSRAGDIALALKHFQQCLVINETLKDSSGIARALTSIGIAYRDINEFEKALDYCKRALKIVEALNDADNLPDSWNQLGIIYKWSGDTINAQNAYTRSLQFAQQNKNPYSISVAKLNLAVIDLDRNLYNKAIEGFEESYEGFKRSNSTNGMSYCLNSLAIAYNKLKKYDKALLYAKEAHDINLKTGYPESLINSSQVLAELYSKLGRYKEAYDMQGYFFKMKDSLSGAEEQKKALKTQLEFENEKKVLGLKKEQENKDIIAAQEKKQHLIIIVSAIICMIILIVFFIFLYNRFKVTKRQKAIIEEQNHLVTEKNREILDSISYAKRLQEAILPPVHDIQKHLPQSFVFYKPKDIVAGDFFWMHTENDSLVLFAVADSTGHGVPGALVSVVCSNALNRSVNEFGLKEPGRILDKTRELVLETFEKSDKDVKDGMDISLVCIQKQNKIVQWAGANNPLWYFKGSDFFEIKADKQPVGKADQPRPFTTHTVQLNSGDSLYLFTDGFADQFGGPNGKKLKYKPFGDVLKQNLSLPIDQQHEVLNSAFMNWQGTLEQVDDVCVVGIRL